MKIVKVVFNKPDGTNQREYSYSWQDEIEIGDTVIVDIYGRDKHAYVVGVEETTPQEIQDLPYQIKPIKEIDNEYDSTDK